MPRENYMAEKSPELPNTQNLPPNSRLDRAANSVLARLPFRGESSVNPNLNPETTTNSPPTPINAGIELQNKGSSSGEADSGETGKRKVSRPNSEDVARWEIMGINNVGFDASGKEIVRFPRVAGGAVDDSGEKAIRSLLDAIGFAEFAKSVDERFEKEIKPTIRPDLSIADPDERDRRYKEALAFEREKFSILSFRSFMESLAPTGDEVEDRFGKEITPLSPGMQRIKTSTEGAYPQEYVIPIEIPKIAEHIRELLVTILESESQSGAPTQQKKYQELVLLIPALQNYRFPSESKIGKDPVKARILVDDLKLVENQDLYVKQMRQLGKLLETELLRNLHLHQSTLAYLNAGDGKALAEANGQIYPGVLDFFLGDSQRIYGVVGREPKKYAKGEVLPEEIKDLGMPEMNLQVGKALRYLEAHMLEFYRAGELKEPFFDKMKRFLVSGDVNRALMAEKGISYVEAAKLPDAERKTLEDKLLEERKHTLKLTEITVERLSSVLLRRGVRSVLENKTTGEIYEDFEHGFIARQLDHDVKVDWLDAGQTQRTGNFAARNAMSPKERLLTQEVGLDLENLAVIYGIDFFSRDPISTMDADIESYVSAQFETFALHYLEGFDLPKAKIFAGKVAKNVTSKILGLNIRKVKDVDSDTPKDVYWIGKYMDITNMAWSFEDLDEIERELEDPQFINGSTLSAGEIAARKALITDRKRVLSGLILGKNGSDTGTPSEIQSAILSRMFTAEDLRKLGAEGGLIFKKGLEGQAGVFLRAVFAENAKNPDKYTDTDEVIAKDGPIKDEDIKLTIAGRLKERIAGKGSRHIAKPDESRAKLEAPDSILRGELTVKELVEYAKQFYYMKNAKLGNWIKIFRNWVDVKNLKDFTVEASIIDTALSQYIGELSIPKEKQLILGKYVRQFNPIFNTFAIIWSYSGGEHARKESSKVFFEELLKILFDPKGY